jgi:hypothetical protein
MPHLKVPLLHIELNKMIMKSCVEKHARNIMRMGTHKIVGQIGKFDPKHQ